MECPLAKSPCLRNTKLRDTSSLDASHLLGAADNDPVVEPRGIDRLSKRIVIVMWWGDTQHLYTAPSSGIAKTCDTSFIFPMTQVSGLKRTGVPVHQRGPHAVRRHDPSPSAKSP
jgi:hypothetical protein